MLVRLAVVVGFASVAIGFLSTQLFYRLTVNQEVAIAHQSIHSLFKTIEATAATAAYLAEKDLAQEVIEGLSTNEVVQNVSMTFENTILTVHENSLINPIVFPIKSLFEPDNVIGELLIEPNIEYIETRARLLAAENSRAMSVQAVVVTFVTIFVASFLITRPMIQIAHTLHQTTPGDGSRLTTPDFHNNSELGLLVQDVNKLLDKTENQFNQERKLREEIEALEKRFRMLFENSQSPIILMDPTGNILLFNSAFQNTLAKLGLPLKKSYGSLLAELFSEPDQLTEVVKTAFENNEIATGEFKLNAAAKDDIFWMQVVITSIINDDLREYYQVTLHDISKRKRDLELLAFQADFDKLTKLHNRQGLEKQIQALMATNTRFALVFMDLNGFKQINDIYGHKSGDEILVFVADRVKKTLRPTDHGGRWGGDEFVLLLENMDEPQVLQHVGRLVKRIAKPYYFSSFESNVIVRASCGAAFYPEQGSELQTLLHLADKAMYHIKEVKESEPERFLQFAPSPDNPGRGNV